MSNQHAEQQSDYFEHMGPVYFHDIVFANINNELTRYNAIMKFVPKSWEQDEETRKLHENVRKTRDEMQHWWLDVVKQLNVLENTLASRTGPMEIKITKEPYWYRAEDVFTLTMDHLADLFTSDDISDPEDFGSYLLQTFLQYVRDGNDYLTDRHPVAKKFMFLRDVFDEALEFRPMRECIGFYAPLLRHVRLERRNLSSELSRSIEDNCIAEISEELEAAEPDDYLNSSKARREIWKAYRNLNCKTRGKHQCFHRRTIDLLHKLQVQSHHEIRNNVLLAVDGHLPNELADVIIEHTLRAEEIPLQSDIRFAKDDTDGLWPFLREEYSCPRI
ncbi:hypothetical protein HII31_12794 [Pseudocercospora fuligena]|uniref:Uncharacterized protein n=1 Tax=Pseudocercospora fuligena TaxID=685502 RepID=A0A8H6R7E4_9PEZI|nr:hypothetical protein HII31_12794 [Pseudocercospora fuligena]